MHHNCIHLCMQGSTAVNGIAVFASAVFEGHQKCMKSVYIHDRDILELLPSVKNMPVK